MAPVRSRNFVWDSARWEGFTFRDDDIVISTPPKCGTTWTQTICALLIFQTPDFPKPVDQMSPWLDMQLRPVADVFADLEAQTHRRFIKTHSPLDALPHDDRVTYIGVGRDPRDVAMSADHHMDNMDLVAFVQQRQEAVGLDDMMELMPDGPPVRLDDPVDRFWQWIDGTAPLGSLADTVHHLDTFWQVRDEPNIVLLHYGELKTDLEGEMRKLADRLGITVEESRWPELVDAATFDSMKARAKDVAPNATRQIWLDTTSFFHKGTTGQWRDLLDDEGCRRYTKRVAELCSPELSAWVHQGELEALA